MALVGGSADLTGSNGTRTKHHTPVKPGEFKGKEKELVAGCRERGFGIWPTLSEPVQVRIGILNQLSPEQIAHVVAYLVDPQSPVNRK